MHNVDYSLYCGVVSMVESIDLQVALCTARSSIAHITTTIFMVTFGTTVIIVQLYLVRARRISARRSTFNSVYVTTRVAILQGGCTDNVTKR